MMIFAFYFLILRNLNKIDPEVFTFKNEIASFRVRYFPFIVKLSLVIVLQVKPDNLSLGKEGT